MSEILTFNPTEASSFLEVIEHIASITPKKTAFTYLNNNEIEETISYERLINEAKQLASYMQQQQYEGKRALIMFPSSISYIKTFIACLFAGVTAIPVYPPTLSRNMDRIENIVNHSSTDIIFTTSTLSSRVKRLLRNTSETITWECLDEILLPDVSEWIPPVIDRTSVAFLQYTSGSTSTPKGVMVTHQNILYNEEMIKQAFGNHQETTILGWLPLYHDMGLIGNVLQPLYLGATSILMDPMDFLQKPFRWLKAISDYKADVSGGPNFAYELCLKKVKESEAKLLNLESWEVAFNGAEPIRSETIERFYQKFSPYGFGAKSFYPCYGMAEATLLISGGNRSDKPIIKHFNSEKLKCNKVVEVNSQTPNRTNLVSCGTTSLEQNIRIIEPSTKKVCQKDEIGEIWVKGENVASGYLHNDQPETFTGLIEGETGNYLQTGDLGFIYESNLYITGRSKDLIVMRGKNYYPQEIEHIVENVHVSIRYGCISAFSVTHENEEKLVVVAELERTFRPRDGKPKFGFDPSEIFKLLRQNIMQKFGIQPYAINLIKTGSIPKTSSGKIKRQACKEDFESNKLITWHENIRK